MAELKRAKAALQAEARETAASRQLEAAVAELAGLLKGKCAARHLPSLTPSLSLSGSGPLVFVCVCVCVWRGLTDEGDRS